MIRKITLSLFVTLITFSTATACDICGCGNNGIYIGILPAFQSSLVGVRYKQNSLKSHIGNNGIDTYLTSKESYSTIEIWGSILLSKKIQFLYVLPYNNNYSENKSLKYSIQGLGDANALLFYNLFQSNKLSLRNKVFIQNAKLSFGIKLPTGKFNVRKNINETQLFTLGTGTVDFNVGTMYEARLQNNGLNLTTNYKINTVNKDGYQFGDKFQLNAQFYHKYFLKNDLSISPNIGLQYESNSYDKYKNLKVDLSGGEILSYSVGSEFKLKKILIGFNFQIPFIQKINEGMIFSYPRSMIHFSYSLK